MVIVNFHPGFDVLLTTKKKYFQQNITDRFTHYIESIQIFTKAKVYISKMIESPTDRNFIIVL